MSSRTQRCTVEFNNIKETHSYSSFHDSLTRSLYYYQQPSLGKHSEFYIGVIYVDLQHINDASKTRPSFIFMNNCEERQNRGKGGGERRLCQNSCRHILESNNASLPAYCQVPTCRIVQVAKSLDLRRDKEM